MTIGEALLNLRKQLGLTQTEMAANVVSTSFYSKVERNIHDIGTNDLLTKFMVAKSVSKLDTVKAIFNSSPESNLKSL